MSLGLVIENIAGTLRQSPAAEDAGAFAGKSSVQVQASPSEISAASEPVSGQAQLTAGFTVVVLQLLNEHGNVVATIPTAQQLAAYRNGTATPPS